MKDYVFVSVCMGAQGATQGTLRIGVGGCELPVTCSDCKAISKSSGHS